MGRYGRGREQGLSDTRHYLFLDSVQLSKKL